jgi:hypothetical protein
MPIPVPDVSLSSSARLEVWKLTCCCCLLGPGWILSSADVLSIGLSALCCALSAEEFWSVTGTFSDVSDDINASLLTCLWLPLDAPLPILPRSSAKFDKAVWSVPTYINKTINLSVKSCMRQTATRTQHIWVI